MSHFKLSWVTLFYDMVTVFNCYNCYIYCAGAATLCEQAHKYGPVEGSIILIGPLKSTGP